MSCSVVLLSIHHLNREELVEVMEGMRQPGTDIEPERVFDALISRDGKAIWVFLYNEGLEALAEDLSEEDSAQIEKVLGGSPQSFIEVEISREPGSQALAIELACLFAERWPCVVSGPNNEVFSSKELFEFRRLGQGFPS